MNVKFPEYNPKWGKSKDSVKNTPGQYHRYYNIHFKYFLNLLKVGGAEIEMIPATRFTIRSQTAFELIIDEKLCLVDFSDFQTSKQTDYEKYDAIFKFHYHPDKHSDIKNMFPFSPVNFHNWPLYKEILNNHKYTAKGKVCNNQSPAGNAYDRRRMVRSMLVEKYGDECDWETTSKQLFYEKISNCLVSVCVPGARNDMLDRGQGQYMFFGVCTISPKLVSYLSYGKTFEPGVHYIECKPDYSDLLEKVEWCRNNTEKCIEIGQNTHKLMVETSIPVRQVEWIKKCINNE